MNRGDFCLRLCACAGRYKRVVHESRDCRGNPNIGGICKLCQGVVKHGRGNGYGAPDLCVMQVPPPPHNYIVFCSNSSALVFSGFHHFMFASFSFQIPEKTQEKDKLKTIYSGFWDSLYYYMCSGDKST